jgi:glutathione peroxidase-family protein
MRILVLLLVIFLSAFTVPLTFYNFQFTTIEGANKQTSQFTGIKTIIVVLPSTRQAGEEVYLHRLDSLSKVHHEIVMIGVPSYEEGFSIDSLESLKTWYRSELDSQFIITAGIYTHKNPATSQHPLFKWLTDKDQNMHFDEDVAGPGHQFFINEQGRLYCVAGPEARFSDKLFTRMME